MSQKHEVQFDLLSNARDSLREAVELIALRDDRSDQARLKHAITNSAHCIELLLKERLGRVCPALIWENVDKYPSLEARTVTVDAAITRLKNICGVVFAPNDETNLRSLQKTRNAITHHEWKTTAKEAKVIVGNALSFAFSFASEELNIDLASEFKKDDTWQSLVDELYEFVRAHGERMEAKIRNGGGFALPCDNCGYPTLPPWGGSCELCGHWQSIDDED
jgi:hypothetical protein